MDRSMSSTSVGDLGSEFINLEVVNQDEDHEKQMEHRTKPPQPPRRLSPTSYLYYFSSFYLSYPPYSQPPPLPDPYFDLICQKILTHCTAGVLDLRLIIT